MHRLTRNSVLSLAATYVLLITCLPFLRHSDNQAAESIYSILKRKFLMSASNWRRTLRQGYAPTMGSLLLVVRSSFLKPSPTRHRQALGHMSPEGYSLTCMDSTPVHGGWQTTWLHPNMSLTAWKRQTSFTWMIPATSSGGWGYIMNVGHLFQSHLSRTLSVPGWQQL